MNSRRRFKPAANWRTTDTGEGDTKSVVRDYGGGSERESEMRQSITVNLEADSRDVNWEYTAIIIYSETRFMMIIDAGCPLFDISVDTI